MASAISLNKSLDRPLLKGKNPGWWKLSKKARYDKVRSLVLGGHDGPKSRTQDVFAYINNNMLEDELALFGENELYAFVYDVLYRRFGIL